MADEAKTIDELPTLSVPNETTILPVNHTANGVTNTYQLAITSIPIYGTPANSTITVTKGTTMYDANYWYVAVANNTLKRVALSSF